VEEGPDLLRPKVDIGGDRSGIMGSEFPLFNFLIYLLGKAFGYAHWHGRLINLVFSSIGTYFFYRFIERIHGRRPALLASLLLLLSIWFSFSRKSMPDTFSISLMMVGMYYALAWLQDGKWLQLAVAGVFLTLAPLCKIPALYFFAALPVVLLMRDLPVRRRWLLAGMSAVAVAITSVWYFIWVPHLLEVYKYELFFPKGFAEGIREILPLMERFVHRFYYSSFLGYAGFLCFLLGAFFLVREKAWRMMVALGLLTGCFLAFAIKTGSVFPLHSYYIIPFTPLLAWIGGVGLSRLPRWVVAVGFLALAGEVVGNQATDFFIQDKEKFRLGLEALCDQHIPKADKVIINGGQGPIEMYYAHRRGWAVEGKMLEQRSNVDDMVARGAKWLILVRQHGPDSLAGYPTVHEDDDYRIQRLQSNLP
jgi:4-amino-4-deoxy-L-arabinose transferase-like glycosyltransferase